MFTLYTCSLDVDSIVQHVDIICIVSLLQQYSVLKVPINPGKSCYRSYGLKKVWLKSPWGSRGATVSFTCWTCQIVPLYVTCISHVSHISASSTKKPVRRSRFAAQSLGYAAPSSSKSRRLTSLNNVTYHIASLAFMSHFMYLFGWQEAVGTFPHNARVSVRSLTIL